jgi:phosphoribosylanthranilate isomerase
MNPPRMGLKFCGLTVLTDLVMSLKLKIDYVGFNFWPSSKRFLSVPAARSLWLEALKVYPQKEQEKLQTQAVGLLVDPDLDRVMEVLREFPELAGIQLHGHESLEFVESVKKHVKPRFVWKAVPIKTREDIPQIAQWVGHVDLILLDALVVQGHGGALSGGLGVAFDWELLKDSALGHVLGQIPWGLAGGIHSDNFLEAQAFKPSFIDICSGIESKPGIKDPEKIKAIVGLRDANNV